GGDAGLPDGPGDLVERLRDGRADAVKLAVLVAGVGAVDQLEGAELARDDRDGAYRAGLVVVAEVLDQGEHPVTLARTPQVDARGADDERRLGANRAGGQIVDQHAEPLGRGVAGTGGDLRGDRHDGLLGSRGVGPIGPTPRT